MIQNFNNINDFLHLLPVLLTLHLLGITVILDLLKLSAGNEFWKVRIRVGKENSIGDCKMFMSLQQESLHNLICGVQTTIALRLRIKTSL